MLVRLVTILGYSRLSHTLASSAISPHTDGEVFR